MMTFLPEALYSGLIRIGGEIKISLAGSLRLTNSSNVMVALVKLKLTVLLGGFSEITLGGVSSFGPPEGVPCFAQRTSNKPASITRIMVKIPGFLNGLVMPGYCKDFS